MSQNTLIESANGLPCGIYGCEHVLSCRWRHPTKDPVAAQAYKKQIDFTRNYDSHWVCNSCWLKTWKSLNVSIICYSML